MTYQTILFDFDGTLFDTWPAVYLTLKLTAENFGVPGIAESNLLKKHSNLDRVSLITKSFNRVPSAKEVDYFVKIYTSIILSKTKAFANVQNIIGYLLQNNIKWGIITNKPKQYIQMFINEVSYLQSNSIVLCPEDVINAKPSAEPLLKACDSLNVKIKETLFVGDGLHDAIAAKSCNMDFAFAKYGYTTLSKEFNYKYILKDIIELKNILSSIS